MESQENAISFSLNSSELSLNEEFLPKIPWLPRYVWIEPIQVLGWKKIQLSSNKCSMSLYFEYKHQIALILVVARTVSPTKFTDIFISYSCCFKCHKISFIFITTLKYGNF